ncbi:MAG: hypothetical protein AVDCRST_MAG71-2508 [uncultured Lysobacter sp.]|uniref:Uncharacterized protein n=1 Tax=uncultured Lysobacter sp. TaxID=271060 RepID=A0A6J4M0A6_9GAMM|nr:MAG: hypothetical protein AVDCRST_MAG71-2508 [uncultured Lysobacter sp.]
MPLVHYVGGPLDCQTGEFAKPPSAPERVWIGRECSRYLLSLMEFPNGTAAWAFVDQQLALSQAMLILHERLQRWPSFADAGDSSRGNRET